MDSVRKRDAAVNKCVRGGESVSRAPLPSGSVKYKDILESHTVVLSLCI